MVLQCCNEENCDCEMSTDWRYVQGKALVIQRRRQEPTTSGDRPFNYSEPISIDIHDYVPGTYIVEIKSCLNSVLQSKIVKI